jgi:hypothetical protein
MCYISCLFLNHRDIFGTVWYWGHHCHAIVRRLLRSPLSSPTVLLKPQPFSPTVSVSYWGYHFPAPVCLLSRPPLPGSAMYICSYCTPISRPRLSCTCHGGTCSIYLTSCRLFVMPPTVIGMMYLGSVPSSGTCLRMTAAGLNSAIRECLTIHIKLKTVIKSVYTHVSLLSVDIIPAVFS